MTATLPEDVWVPVPLRWRHVQAGDVFLGRDRLWSVGAAGPARDGLLYATVYCGTESWQGSIDPDDVINVLVPVNEREAVELSIEQLGARLVERREATAVERELPAPPEFARQE